MTKCAYQRENLLSSISVVTVDKDGCIDTAGDGVATDDAASSNSVVTELAAADECVVLAETLDAVELGLLVDVNDGHVHSTDMKYCG